MHRSTSSLVLFLFPLCLILAACGDESGQSGTPLGGACVADGDCAVGLQCLDAVCAPASDVIGGDTSSSGADTSEDMADASGELCGGSVCGVDQACVTTDGASSCENVDCAGAMCSATDRCEETGGPNGGAICVDLSCADTAECGDGEVCEGNLCVPDVCVGVDCAADQRCENQGGTGMCVEATCADVMASCSATERCEEATGPNGGASCVDVSCARDVECPEAEFCDGTICVPDACDGGASRCDSDDVIVCAENGSAESIAFTCGSMAGSSICGVDGNGDATCSCAGDWDCPDYTYCEAGACLGTGEPPTCFLPAQPFTGALPTNEITWGGTANNRDASGSPFPSSAQVVLTPLVANLDDDNGDGLVDERDFPEIIFTTFCNSDFRSNGVLRAIHGGGQNKGGDYFASCAGTLWNEGDANFPSCNCGDADLDSTASLAVGDLNADGTPEIVAITEGDGSHQGTIRIYSNRGEVLATGGTNVDFRGDNPAPSIANLDQQGFAEVVVGRHAWTVDVALDGTWSVLDHFEGGVHDGTNGQGPASCVADIAGDARMEIVGGTTAYTFPRGPVGVMSQADCVGDEVDEEADWCNGVLPTLWDANTVDGAATNEGFCAIVDIWGSDQDATSPNFRPGPNNLPDGAPEVVTISNGDLQVLNGETGQLIYTYDYNAGNNGGAPNIDDFDGDGFLEIGTAGGTAYVMIDLQTATVGGACDEWPNTPANDSASAESANVARTPPATPCTQSSDCGDVDTFACNEHTGECVCLHNGWRRGTEDDSSRVTGSSVFDFNGDGRAEVVYNDECRFRIYDGLDATVYMDEVSESRTRIEYPIVADVDNDGNAEIIFATTNESGFCSQNQDSSYNNGIEVWGDQNDYWVSARRIWNQHTYHVTNITEGGQVPVVEPKNWLNLNNRSFNTYRSQPRSLGTAPDLTIGAVQVTSPGSSCGVLSSVIEIVVLVRNDGDLRVGPGVVLSFEGDWGGNVESLGDGAGGDLQFELTTSLEPGGSTRVTVTYDAANNTAGVLPDSVNAIIDGLGSQRECDETNNGFSAPIVAGAPDADLRVELDSASATSCPAGSFGATVFNDGAVAASDIVLRFYAGDPEQGGTAIDEVTIPGPIEPGMSETITLDTMNMPFGLVITVYAVVDPDDTIVECNDGNNAVASADTIQCQIF